MVDLDELITRMKWAAVVGQPLTVTAEEAGELVVTVQAAELIRGDFSEMVGSLDGTAVDMEGWLWRYAGEG